MTLEKIKNALTTEINPKINNYGKNKLASVLIIIYDSPPKILMTKKPASMMQHGGEISFPGGKISDSDTTLLDTAIREVEEETGLKITKDQVNYRATGRVTVLFFFGILKVEGEFAIRWPSSPSSYSSNDGYSSKVEGELAIRSPSNPTLS